MIDNCDTDPDVIRASHTRRANPVLNVQKAQSLGLTTSTVSDVQSQSPGGGGGGGVGNISSGSGAGGVSFGSDVQLNPGGAGDGGEQTDNTFGVEKLLGLAD